MSQLGGVPLFSRSDWGAAPRRNSPRVTRRPVAIVVHHEGGRSPRPNLQSGVFNRIKANQRYHQDTKGWTDLAYNFGVEHTVGGLIVGRGDQHQNGANSPRNEDTLSVLLLGNRLTTPILDANEKRALLALSRAYDLPLLPHSAVSGTDCPGPVIEEWIAAGAPPPEPDPGDETERLRRALRDTRAILNEVKDLL